MDIAKDFSKKSNYAQWEFYGEKPKTLPKILVHSKSINDDRNFFRKELNELIKIGNDVKTIFE